MSRPPTAADRGRALEQRIGAYFAHHGYAVETNRVLVGRSGARHEIDVLAEKGDDLATFRVAIECKAWDAPIEKDVVAKLHYVMSDLGLTKGIVVSLAGARSGAATAAASFGIDIWGPDELRRHLGEDIFADVAAPAPAFVGAGNRAIVGWRFGTDPDRAKQTIEATGRGRLGIRTLEQLVWFAPVWLPAHLLRLSVAQPRVHRMRRQVTSTARSNIYDALEGRRLRHPDGEPAELLAGDAVVVKPLRRPAQIGAELRKAVDARLKVTTAAAIERHDAKLTTLGLPTPLHGITVDDTADVHLPVFVGLMRGNAQERVAAVDGTDGQLSEQLGRIVTAQLSHLRNAYR